MDEEREFTEAITDLTNNNIKKHGPYAPLCDKCYYRQFGINPNRILGDCKKSRRKLLKRAFKKAWEIRNFEIDKFWQRTAFFWGFIVLIFGAYIKVLTSSLDTALKVDLVSCLILLGIIFSVAWLLVIKGSKAWQENWEKHIDKLEDTITGPLYKTIYYKGVTFYSVSKVNKILAQIIIVVWVGLFIHHIINNYEFIYGFTSCIQYSFSNIDWFLTISVLFAIGCIVYLLCKGRTSDGKFKTMPEKDEEGRFFNRMVMSTTPHIKKKNCSKPSENNNSQGNNEKVQ
jgi:hypothetical protein